MAEPASWLFLQWVKAQIEQIAIDEGYLTDIGAAPVVLDDDQVDDRAALPPTIVEATAIRPTSQSPRSLNSDIEVAINFAVPRGDGTSNPKLLLHRARADLVRVLKVNPRARGLPNFIREVEVGDAVLGFTDPDENGNALVLGQLDVRAGLTELE